MKYPNGRCIVCRDETGTVVGFVTSVSSAAKFYCWLMPRFFFRILRAGIRSSPKALFTIARRLFTRLLGGKPRDPVFHADAECSAFAVDPLISDPSIAPLLTAAFLLDAKRRGLNRIISGVRVDNPRLLRMAHLFGYRDLHREARPDGHEMQILLWSEDSELGDKTA